MWMWMCDTVYSSTSVCPRPFFYYINFSMATFLFLFLGFLLIVDYSLIDDGRQVDRPGLIRAFTDDRPSVGSVGRLLFKLMIDR